MLFFEIRIPSVKSAVLDLCTCLSCKLILHVLVSFAQQWPSVLDMHIVIEKVVSNSSAVSCLYLVALILNTVYPSLVLEVVHNFFIS